MLLLCDFTEELDLLLRSRLPVVISFECTLQMRFNIHVKGLRLELAVRRVVDTRNDFSGVKVM